MKTEISDAKKGIFTLEPQKIHTTILTIIACLFAIFHLYTAAFGLLPPMQQRAIHLGFAMFLVLLAKPYFKNKSNHNLFFNYLLAITGFVGSMYVYFNAEAIALRAGLPNSYDLYFGIVVLILLFEAIRRTNMWSIGVIALLAIGYFFFGNRLSGVFAHSGFNWEFMVSNLYLSLEGIYGLILGASANFIVLFLLLSALLNQFKISDVLYDLSRALVGNVRGGPTKVAVASSALMGTVSGSGVANVVITGAFTIPLMKKSGYSSKYAAAVESSASTGGQMMPPIMGSAAFIMAEVIGVPYFQIALAAFIPSVIYYLALYIQVDGEAARIGLKNEREESLPKAKEILRERGHLLIPLLALVIFLVIGWSAMKSCFWSIIVAMVVSYIRKETRWNFKSLFQGLASGGIQAAEIAVLTAIAGIVVGVLSMTGITVDLTSILVDLSGNSLVILLILAMFGSIILGMGMPPVAVYVILAIFIAPALVSMGVTQLGAHLFVFYFGMLALVTPPVANAVFVASGIADSKPMETGVLAVRLSIGGFIVPYYWIYRPGLIFQGDTIDIITSILFALIGILSMAFAFGGYFKNYKISIWERIILIISGILIIEPNLITSIVGVLIIGFVIVLGYLKTRRKTIAT